MDNFSLEVLLSPEQIESVVTDLAEQINRDYKDKKLLLVGLLKGSIVFMSDLMRKIKLPCEVDFISASSYGSSTHTCGTVKITKDLSADISNYDVLVVEDIVDSGVTLSCILDILRDRGPQSIRLCTLLDKPDRRIKEVFVDYRGICIPDKFVVGYGLDYAEKYRNLPSLCVLKNIDG